jgi:hypothetical protein
VGLIQGDPSLGFRASRLADNTVMDDPYALRESPATKTSKTQTWRNKTMKILDRANAISALLTQDQQTTGGLLSLPMQGAAIAATLGGIKSEAWKNYMSILASNEDQLKRLTGNDDLFNESYVRESSAYLVSNSTCGGLTPQRLPQFVDPRIDDDLSPQTDPNFVRFINFEFPAPAPNPGDEQPT